MTKEEFIEQLTDARKEGADSAMLCVCEKVKCSECPYFESNHCSFEIIDDLIDYIIDNKLERQETNLEHYWDRLYVYFSPSQIDGYLDYVERNMNVREWLLQPYEEPKSKYKLTQFEYDLIEARRKAYGDNAKIKWIYIDELRKLGYLKGVPKDAEVGEILENAEVIDENEIRGE